MTLRVRSVPLTLRRRSYGTHSLSTEERQPASSVPNELISVLALAREHQERGHQAYALRLLGDIAAYRAPPGIDQAAVHYRQALSLAEELGMRPLVVHCHLGLGTLYASVSQSEQARAALTTAIAMYRAMDMTFWLPQAEAALAQVA